MNKRIWLGSIASLVTVLAASVPVAAQQPKKPNIVVMLADNLGYGELGVYGGGILRGAPTPRIDATAEMLSAQGYATGMWGKWHLGSARGPDAYKSRVRRVVRHPAHVRRGDVAVAQRDEKHVAIGRE
jgi:arylsulfatase A-like enzyme